MASDELLLRRFSCLDPDKKYKIIGFLIDDKDGKPVYVFDLKLSKDSPIVKRTRRTKAEIEAQKSVEKTGSSEAGYSDDNSAKTSEREKPKLSEIAMTSFGDTVEENERMMNADSLKDYAPYDG